MQVETPQSFVTKTEADKVAFHYGFRQFQNESNGWRQYTSNSAKGAIWIAYETQKRWIIATDNQVDGPGKARYRFGTMNELYAIMPREARRFRSLDLGQKLVREN